MNHARRLYALLLCLLAVAGAQQELPVVVELEAFVIRDTTAAGTAGETREAAQRGAGGQILVPPGERVEYVLTLRNRGEATLPPATVILRGPVPATTRYLEGSATPSSEAVRTEFSVDNGETFAETPVAEDGTPIPPEGYQVVRWTLLQPLEAGATLTFVYRVVVAEAP